MKPMLIIGGGLVGSALAVFLARRGYAVEVYERNPDFRKQGHPSGRSINLTLCERGLRVLDSLGMGERVRALSVPVYGRAIHLADGGLLRQPYGNHQEAIYSILRRDLNHTLLDRAEQEPNVRLGFGTRFVRFDLETMMVELRRAGEAASFTRPAARIFGTDGAFSAVRQQLQRRDRFNYSQHYVSQGYRELHLPVTEELPWTRERNVLHLWPRDSYMFIAFPNPGGSFTLALHLPFTGPVSFDTVRTGEDFIALVRRDFPDLLPCAARLAPEFLAHPTVSMVTIRCAPWTVEGKLALMGDAAHAIVPSYGQGANAGLEDSATFDECLATHGEDWPAVMAEFERRRLVNAETIADLALEHFHELQDAVKDPRFHLRKELERYLNRRYPKQYRDLYSMVTFTCMPYAEAARIDRAQRALVEQLLGVPDVAGKLARDELHETVDALLPRLPLSA